MNETEMYFNFLLHVAAADEILEDEEIKFLETALLAVGANNTITQDIMEKIAKFKNNEPLDGLQEVIDSVTSSSNPSLVMTLIRDGYMLAISDGNVDETELVVIKKLFMSFDGSSDKLFNKAIRWAEKSLALKEDGEEIYRTLSLNED